MDTKMPENLKKTSDCYIVTQKNKQILSNNITFKAV